MRDDGEKKMKMGHESSGHRDGLLAPFRMRIDELDAQILALLNERMDEALAIGRIKEESDMALLDSRREAAVLRRLHELNRGPLANDQVDRIYRAIMEVSRDLQKRGER